MGRKEKNVSSGEDTFGMTDRYYSMETKEE